MTVVATLALPEAAARALAAAIAEDAILGERSLDLSETAPGRWLVTVYFEGDPDAGDKAALARLASGKMFAFAALPETDWVAKSLEGLKPVRAGRFLVHGGHDRAARRPNDIAIEIEAGQAFGTGHHGTTAGCLMAIDRLAKSRPIRNALDLGTGSGVLADRARPAWPTRGFSPPTSTRWRSGSRRRTLKLNGVAARVATAVADGLGRRVIARTRALRPDRRQHSRRAAGETRAGDPPPPRAGRRGDPVRTAGGAAAHGRRRLHRGNGCA